MTNVVVVLVDPILLQDYRKDMAKVKMMVLYGILDHIVPHIAEKGTTKEMMP